MVHIHAWGTRHRYHACILMTRCIDCHSIWLLRNHNTQTLKKCWHYLFVFPYCTFLKTKEDFKQNQYRSITWYKLIQLQCKTLSIPNVSFNSFIEKEPICYANQWIRFCMIGTSVTKELTVFHNFPYSFWKLGKLRKSFILHGTMSWCEKIVTAHCGCSLLDSA